MSSALDVVLLREIGLSAVVVDGEPMHLLHVRARNGETVSFAMNNEHLSALIVRAQECLAKGIEYEFNA
jgi:hypothetical protein